MPTALELLETEGCDDILVVDLESRTIKIPSSVKVLGVEADDETRILHFQVPRHTCGVDLSEFVIRVNYRNANGEGDLYMVTDPIVEDKLIKFDWVVGRHAFAKKGNVAFNVCLKDIFEGVVRREFNTTVAFLPVLEGLETSTEFVEEHTDIFEQLKEELATNIEDAASAAIGDYITEHADEIKGPKGDAFKYEDFTEDQLAELIGPKGDAFKYEDFTAEQLESLKGPQGDAFEYEDFTEEQLAKLAGPAGSSIQSITCTSGTGAPGTTDTYTVTLTDGSTTTFQVYNGKDGEGAGDMTSDVYDPRGKKQDIFKYVEDTVNNLEIPSESGAFYVNVSENSSDKTFAEIREAYDAGKTVIAICTLSMPYYESGEVYTMVCSNYHIPLLYFSEEGANIATFSFFDNSVYIVIHIAEDGRVVVRGDYVAYNMDSGIYDPQGKAQDIFQYVDDAVGNLDIPDASGIPNLGENITEGSTNDTVAFWAEKGSGQAWFSATNMLVNQPAQYGFVISYTNGADVFQMFSDQTNGVTYFRYGDNVNNWFKHWAALELPGMATDTELGLVMVNGNNGIGVNTEDGNLYIKQASNIEIDGKAHSYKPITPENLDYAVKAALTNNANELSDTERASALGWLGAAASSHDHVSSEITGLATVATSGSYNDLSNKPTIPSAYTHPSSHAASMISAGTFAGQVVAKSDAQTPGTSLLRNSKLVSADTNPSNNGEINWTYG